MRCNGSACGSTVSRSNHIGVGNRWSQESKDGWTWSGWKLRKGNEQTARSRSVEWDPSRFLRYPRYRGAHAVADLSTAMICRVPTVLLAVVLHDAALVRATWSESLLNPSTDAPPSPAPKPLLWLPLGDSITWGCGTDAKPR